MGRMVPKIGVGFQTGIGSHGGCGVPEGCVGFPRVVCGSREL